MVIMENIEILVVTISRRRSLANEKNTPDLKYSIVGFGLAGIPSFRPAKKRFCRGKLCRLASRYYSGSPSLPLLPSVQSSSSLLFYRRRLSEDFWVGVRKG